MSSKTVTIMIIGKRDQNRKLIQNHVEVNWGSIIERIIKYDSKKITKTLWSHLIFSDIWSFLY